MSNYEQLSDIQIMTNFYKLQTINNRALSILSKRIHAWEA